MRQQRGGQVPARRRTHDADSMRIKLPLPCPRPDQTHGARCVVEHRRMPIAIRAEAVPEHESGDSVDRKSTRLNSSHVAISYAVFCLKKKKNKKKRIESQ